VIVVGGTETGPTPPPGRQTAVAELARALTDFEAEVSGRRVDRILVTDDSDAALAAVLVGAKLPTEVVATPRARDAASANGRLIAQLAGAYTAPA
jgi:predicted nuclease of predicted toxin-antitoxin system